jgi:hypothetical protein
MTPGALAPLMGDKRHTVEVTHEQYVALKGLKKHLEKEEGSEYIDYSPSFADSVGYLIKTNPNFDGDLE